MKIIVEANEIQWKELEIIPGINWIRVNDDEDFKENENASAYFNLVNNTKSLYNNLPLVFCTLINQIANKQAFCINAWPGFLLRNSWEIIGVKNQEVEELISSFGKKVMWAKDEFISTRIISMIINEAYFALEEKVSTKEEINTAMKLGTGYPFGPFEWAEKIGLKNVFNVLDKLSKTDERYNPSEFLKMEAIK